MSALTRIQSLFSAIPPVPSLNGLALGGRDTLQSPLLKPEPKTAGFAAKCLRHLLEISCFVLIAFVSGLDTWFAIENRRILMDEQNPICAALLRLDPHSCFFFFVGKMLGTLVCISAIYMLLRCKYRYAHLVLGIVTAFQLGLLIYLLFADKNFYGLPNIELMFTDTQESIWDIAG